MPSLLSAANDQWRALVDRLWFDIEYPPGPVECDSSGLFGDKGDWVGLVE
jgi:hypothetical protein